MINEFEVISRYRQGESKRSISRKVGINRKTVQRICDRYDEGVIKVNHAENHQQLEKATENLVLKRKYDTSNRKTRTFTPEVESRMKELIEEEKNKTKKLGPHKQALTAKAVTEILNEEGHSIKYRTVAHYWSQLNKNYKETFIRQEYELGYRVEFDFGEVKLEIDGQVNTYYLAVFACPASNYFWAYLYPNQKREVFQDAHVNFFEQIGGVYREVVYDNMRNVVSRFIGRHEKELNPQLIQLATYYGFNINVTNCFSGNEKGTVEGRVKKVRQSCFTKVYQFKSFEEACQHLQDELVKLNKGSQIEEEKSCLLHYRPPFELADFYELKVTSYSTIHFQNVQYSVPDYLVGEKVQVKVYYNRLAIFSNQIEVARHEKTESSQGFCLNIFHYIKTFRKKPGALRHSLALKHNPELKTLFEKYYSENPKGFLDILEKYPHLTAKELLDQVANEMMTTQNEARCASKSNKTDAVIRQTQETLHQLNKIFGLEEIGC